MTKDLNDDLWSNDAHWSGGIYFCKQDLRLWVPKRSRWTGWTLNSGHRYGTAALVLLTLFPFLLLLGIFLLTVLSIASS